MGLGLGFRVQGLGFEGLRVPLRVPLYGYFEDSLKGFGCLGLRGLGFVYRVFEFRV